MQLAEKNFDLGSHLILKALMLFKSQPESHYYFDTAIRTFDQVIDILAICNYKGAKELYNEMVTWSDNINKNKCILVE